MESAVKYLFLGHNRMARIVTMPITIPTLEQLDHGADYYYACPNYYYFFKQHTPVFVPVIMHSQFTRDENA